MKILMTVIMAMAVTSTFAAEKCTLGGECKVEADCKSLNANYALVGGKCTNPASKETETQCAGIVSSSGAKGATTDAAGTGTKPADNTGR